MLIGIATNSKDLWVVTECLDAIMDVFADDSNNSHLSELGIISTLTVISPQLKSMVRIYYNYLISYIPSHWWKVFDQCKKTIIL